MFGNKSFLMLGEGSADIKSLLQKGHEILDCNFSFLQGTDPSGKATTKVHGGTITMTLSRLPSLEVIEWALQSRKYMDGCIVLTDAENNPIEKTYFRQAACVDMEIHYQQTGSSYAATRLIIQAGCLIVGDGITFENEWIDY